MALHPASSRRFCHDGFVLRVVRCQGSTRASTSAVAAARLAARMVLYYCLARPKSIGSNVLTRDLIRKLAYGECDAQLGAFFTCNVEESPVVLDYADDTPGRAVVVYGFA